MSVPEILSTLTIRQQQSTGFRDLSAASAVTVPPVSDDIRLDLVETRTFGSRVIYERYGRARQSLPASR
jgi:hypothetical protein